MIFKRKQVYIEGGLGGYNDFRYIKTQTNKTLSLSQQFKNSL